MTTTQSPQAVALVIELGEGIPSETGTRAQDVFAALLARRDRLDTAIHVRVIRDHDPDRPQPVTVRAMVDPRQAARVTAGSPDAGVDALAEVVADWFDGDRSRHA